MRRFTAHRIPLTFAVAALGLLLIAPAGAKSPSERGKKKGKRAIGTVAAFDPASMVLSVEFRDGSMFEAPLSDKVKIKLENRGGTMARGGKPSRGSVEDIDVGDKVLKLKARRGEVREVRLRDVASEVADANGGECKDSEPAEEPEVSIDDGAEAPAEDPAASEGDEGSDAGPSCADKVDQPSDEAEPGDEDPTEESLESPEAPESPDEGEPTP